MYQLPILSNSGKTAKYGNDFNLLYSNTINNGMMDSSDPVEDHNTGVLATTYDPTGIYKQQIIFEHNDDPTEEQRYTDAQAMQYILNRTSLTRPISEQEMKMNMYSNVPLDPRFRAEMVNEAIESKSNMFGLHSQDFVKLIRKSNETYTKERNIYKLPSSKHPIAVQQKLNSIQLKSDFSDPINDALSYIMNQGKEDKKQKEQDNIKMNSYRETAVPRSKPTQEQEFYEKVIKKQP